MLETTLEQSKLWGMVHITINAIKFQCFNFNALPLAFVWKSLCTNRLVLYIIKHYFAETWNKNSKKGLDLSDRFYAFVIGLKVEWQKMCKNEEIKHQNQ